MKRQAIHLVRSTLRRLVPLLRHAPGAPPESDPGPGFVPRKILLMHPGHIGDLVLATAVLEPLQRAFPEAEIGFLVNSWSAGVVNGIAAVSRVHILDHWRLNRKDPGFAARWKRYRATRRSVLRELRAEGYDTAIALLDVDPDLLDVAWRAGIPVRIGFRSSYFAPLATRTVEHSGSPLLHQVLRQAHTLQALGIAAPAVQLRSQLPPDTPEALAELRAVLGVEDLHGVNYRIVHMGAGALYKEASVNFWRGVVEQLSATRRVLLTGRGEHERQMAEEVARGLPNCIVACDRLSWDGYVAAVRGAQALYGVDSMAGHVAAAVGTPGATVHNALAESARWRPFSDRILVFNNFDAQPPALPLEPGDLTSSMVETVISEPIHRPETTVKTVAG